MPRPKKPRRCKCPSAGKAFKPCGVPLGRTGKVLLLVEELEALRLCDAEGLTQEEAGRRMGVSRGTVQRILESARSKVAVALSGCKAIMLEKPTCLED